MEELFASSLVHGAYCSSFSCLWEREEVLSAFQTSLPFSFSPVTSSSLKLSLPSQIQGAGWFTVQELGSSSSLWLVWPKKTCKYEYYELCNFKLWLSHFNNIPGSCFWKSLVGGLSAKNWPVISTQLSQEDIYFLTRGRHKPHFYGVVHVSWPNHKLNHEPIQTKGWFVNQTSSYWTWSHAG